MNRYGLYFATLIVGSFPLFGFAEQVTININANVIDNTCSISADTTSFAVGMATGQFKGTDIGVPFVKTPFSIYLEDCPDSVTTAHVTFSGSSDLSLPNLIRNENNSSLDATGVAVGLYNKQQENINIQSNSTDFTINHASNKTELGFVAAYVRTSNQYTAGKVTGVVTFEISYD